MSLILPAPIEPRHPAPWWCSRCGQLEAAGCGHPRNGPSGPPPLPPGRDGRSIRRHRDYLAGLGRVVAPRVAP